MRTKNTFLTILGVVVAVVIAWWLVGFLFSAVWFLVRLVIVAIVAVGVLIVLRSIFGGSNKDED